MFNAWYDDDQGKARPIDDLVGELDAGTREVPDGRGWGELDALERRKVIDSFRLAYLDEVAVNWCPALGTVLANEEVTAEGRSERGNHPVYKRPLEQWMLRITKYAERLLGDLDVLDWPESIKIMQRNWIGRSEGADIVFPVEGHEDLAIRVFTTRPDTVFGATYMVLAPELDLVDEIVASEWPRDTPLEWRGTFGIDVSPVEAVEAYRNFASEKTDLERQAEGREKTGIFIGAYAINPVNDERIPIFIADYVLAGYGTGAIMAVPGQDQRDWDFAEEFDLPIVRTVQPAPDFDGDAYLGDGPAINSGFLDGLNVENAKRKIVEWLEETSNGAGAVTYKLRDWLFSRQRYWGEPFPIVYDETGLPLALPESMLPVELPEMTDFQPRIVPDDEETLPAPPLARAEDWVTVEADLGDGTKTYLRETNTMPQWAGSCWYYLRYLDPTNENRIVEPEVERYWMQGDRRSGGVDLYVGGAEQAVLHLLYARFWHKVLYDLANVSTPEPFARLFNQGTITAYEYLDERGVYVAAKEVEERDGKFFFEGKEVTRQQGRMGKSRKNGVAPDDIYAEYGADTLRLYEMFMGPLDASRPWNTADIVGVHRFLQRFWRNAIDEETGAIRVSDAPADEETRRILHRTVDAVRADLAKLQFNTAIARLFELNNRLTAVVGDTGAAPIEVVSAMTLMLAPLAPHLAEEVWARLGHAESLAYEPFPEPDPAYLVVEEVEIPVQVDGKVRARVKVPAGAGESDHEAGARADERIASILDGVEVLKVIVVPGRLVNFVTR
jgi:leucyl-tRNA synthetase